MKSIELYELERMTQKLDVSVRDIINVKNYTHVTKKPDEVIINYISTICPCCGRRTMHSYEFMLTSDGCYPITISYERFNTLYPSMRMSDIVNRVAYLKQRTFNFRKI